MNTKVQTLPENPNFLAEAGEYLEANGYKREDGKYGISYYRQNQGVAITGDCISFFELNEGEEGQRAHRFEPRLEVSRITHIDNVFDWMLLFHVAGIVPLKQFIRNARKLGGNVDGLQSIMRHFQVTDDHNAVPTSY